RAAVDGFQANVRFTDAFAGRTLVADGVSQVTLQGVGYVVVAAFRTRSDLVCLVSGVNGEALRALFGLPADWPLTAAVLNRQMVLNPGQRITVEGTVVGTAVGEKYVLVDSVLFDGAPPGAIRREMQIWWPGAQEPSVITAPGTSTVEFPCTHVEGETESVEVTVRALTPEAVMEEVSRMAAQREGRPTGVKTYGQYSAGDVYRHARDNNRVDVDFADVVTAVFGPNLPTEIAFTSGLRAGMPVRLRVGSVFQTDGRLTCLVPADLPVLLSRAATVLPGEDVRVRGTIVGQQGEFACVLVDYIGFPAQDAATGGDVWLVRLTWPASVARVFWDYGLYDVVGLPCQHALGRQESLRVLLGDFKLVEIEVPAEPAPIAPEPAEEPAEEEAEEAPEVPEEAAAAPGEPAEAPEGE
ncbi:MAG: hypothetical protein ACYTFZ_04705, partial [Planctomycetota bacterium]